MPYNNEYEQKISEEKEKEAKQTMIVDLVMLASDCGTCKAGIILAEILPNDDKLSLTIGGGKRNVYHRQIGFISGHWFTIGHENTHSLGPNRLNYKL